MGQTMFEQGQVNLLRLLNEHVRSQKKCWVELHWRIERKKEI